MYENDTIVAIATAIGEGGIGIIRLSGPQAISIAAQVFYPKNGNLREASGYTAHYGHLKKDSQIIDEGICLIMRAPHSYTAEDVVELQMHGGMTVLRKTLEYCLDLGARLAERGEFTERAFLNGRLDLAQAEAVKDIISARTDAGLRIAVGQLGGRLSNEVDEMTELLAELISSLEAVIDYPEEDLAEKSRAEIDHDISIMRERLQRLIQRSESGRCWREGLRTVITGLPNAGKSSLLNLLLEEERAIVTDVPGTTRDTISEYANIGGIPLHLVDTAGIRNTTDTVEKIGIDRAQKETQEADLILAMIDGSQACTSDTLAWLKSLQGRRVIVLLNKADLPLVVKEQQIRDILGDISIIPISAQTGLGVDTLTQAIKDSVEEDGLGSGEEVLLTNTRQMNHARQAETYLENAYNALQSGLPEDCITEDLRYAWAALNAILGREGDRDIVSEIFRRFCVGK